MTLDEAREMFAADAKEAAKKMVKARRRGRRDVAEYWRGQKEALERSIVLLADMVDERLD